MNQWKLFLVLAFGLLVSAPLCAGTSDYTLVLPDVTTGTSTDVLVIIELDAAGGEDMSGFSFGVCHEDLVSIGAGDVVNGADVQALNGGTGPGFSGLTFVSGGGAWTIGVLTTLTGTTVLEPADDLEMYKATYSAGATTGVADLTFCVAGSPPVAITIVTGASEVTPDTVDGSITIEEVLIDNFTYRAKDAEGTYCGEDGIGDVTTQLTIAQNPDHPLFPTETAGFSMACAHDDALLTLTAADIAPGPLADMNGGQGPDFAGINLTPNGGADAGMTVGCVYSLTGGISFTFDEETDVMELTWETVAASFTGDADGTTTDTPVTFSDEIGDPVVTNIVVTDGGSGSEVPKFVNGTLTLLAQCAAPANDFVRGDPNDDGFNNIADGIWLLSELFRGGPKSTCFNAADANNDNKVNQSDAIFIFNYQFMDGPAPPAPFPSCGQEANQTPEQCASQDSCD